MNPLNLPRYLPDEMPRAQQMPSTSTNPYVIKYEALKAKMAYVQESNNLLRNRLYHVKKEIVYLERLKRVLCNKLLACNDEFFVAQLEIPDDEGSTGEEQMKKRIGPLIQSLSTSTSNSPMSPMQQQASERKEPPPRPPRKRKSVSTAASSSQPFNPLDEPPANESSTPQVDPSSILSTQFSS